MSRDMSKITHKGLTEWLRVQDPAAKTNSQEPSCCLLTRYGKTLYGPGYEAPAIVPLEFRFIFRYEAETYGGALEILERYAQTGSFEKPF